MDTITVGPYAITYDRSATIEAHSRIAAPGPELCGCWYCRNWAEGRSRLLPTAIGVILVRRLREG